MESNTYNWNPIRYVEQQLRHESAEFIQFYTDISDRIYAIKESHVNTNLMNSIESAINATSTKKCVKFKRDNVIAVFNKDSMRLLIYRFSDDVQ